MLAVHPRYTLTPYLVLDCLKDIGHACGHNLIATASVAAALATAECMRRHSLAGKVILYGTPAEEGGGGKIRLLDAGAYKDHLVDVSLMAHPGQWHFVLNVIVRDLLRN